MGGENKPSVVAHVVWQIGESLLDGLRHCFDIERVVIELTELGELNVIQPLILEMLTHGINVFVVLPAA